MTPERYRQIGEIFDAWLEAPEAGREDLLRAGCGEDAPLRAEVELLLASHRQAPDFLVPATQPAVESIGPYRILRQIGEGGMGIVYLALQSEPIRREVALKVIRPGMGTLAINARFAEERRALALMDHPHIARIFDGGSTPQGEPYVVMEYVDGGPITRYCEEQRLSVRQRIELFLPVCQAIHHAHQKGIIHRDIKPSNVLVKVSDGVAIPKVIDFGLAKALDPEESGATRMTHVGTILGTLQYMSPEQASPGERDIDTRSDVYSLGALLYELLTGTTPLDATKLGRENYLALLERVRDEEPMAPSVRRRESWAGAVPLDRELDWIPLKALEKERDRRYDSVNGLARDLERYLAGEPVEAAPPSRAYRLRKFVRRHRVGFAVAAAVAVVLVAAVVISASQAVRARQAEQEASAVNAFLRTDVLAQADPRNQAKPNVAPDANLTVRTALDRAARQVGGKFPRQPLVEAAIRETIGDAYQGLGIYPKAEEQARRALELRRAALGERDRATLRSRQQLARLVSVQGRYRDSEPLFRDLLEARRAALGAQDPDTLATAAALAQSYRLQGKFAPAVELFRQTEAVSSRVLGAEHPDTLALLENLGSTYFEQRALPQAEAIGRQVLEARRRRLGEEHPDTVRQMGALAATYHVQRRYPEAEAHYRRALAVQRRVNGVAHPDTLVTLYNLATLLSPQKRYAEALALFEENRAARGAVYPPDHPRTLRLLVNLADLYGRVGRPAEELRLLNEAYAGQRRVLGADHPDTLSTLSTLAELSTATQPARSEAMAREALAGLNKRFGGGHPSTTEAAKVLAKLLAGQRRYGEAESILRASLAAIEPSGGEYERFQTLSELGALAAAQRHWSTAEPLLREAYAGLLDLAQSTEGLDNVRETGERLVDLYTAQGESAQAVAWRERVAADAARLAVRVAK